MRETAREGWIVCGVAALAAWLCFAGLGWGLPSADVDHLLFGTRTPWTGAEVLRLADAPARSADVWRARAVRRYRLETTDPAEGPTFAAVTGVGGLGVGGLAERRPTIGRAIYVAPVKLALWATAVARGEAAVMTEAEYLDHPARVRRIYWFARSVSAGGGVLLAVAAYLLMRRTLGRRAGLAAGVAAAMNPWSLAAAHAAGPTMPVAALLAVLLAAVALRWVPARAAGRWTWRTVAPAAVGLVLLPFALRYRQAFETAAGPAAERFHAAALIDHAAGGTLFSAKPPGPATLPPVDLWRWTFVKDAAADVFVRPIVVGADAATLQDGRIRLANATRHVWFATPLTRADRPFEVVVKQYRRRLTEQLPEQPPPTPPVHRPVHRPVGRAGGGVAVSRPSVLRSQR